MATFLELAKIKHHAVRSDGAKFLDGERNDSLNTSWLTVNSSGRVTLGPGLYDELLVVKGEVSDDQIKAWASMGAPFYDPTPVIPDEQIPSAQKWNSKARTYYQPTPPVATAVGDLWVDTDDNDRLYRWDGTKWIDITDKSPVDAEKKPVYVKGAGADIDIDKYGIRATRKTDGKKTFEIDAETGDARFAGDISGASGTFGNGSIHIGEDGLRAEKNGNTTFEIDSDGNAYFSGEISATSILSNSLLLSALTDFSWVTASNEVLAGPNWSTIPGMTLQVTVDSPTVLFIIANSGAKGAAYYEYYDTFGDLWYAWANAEVRLRVNGSVRVTTHKSPYVSPMFHVESVNPGTHTIQMEWREEGGGFPHPDVSASYRGIYVLKLRR